MYKNREKYQKFRENSEEKRRNSRVFTKMMCAFIEGYFHTFCSIMTSIYRGERLSGISCTIKSLIRAIIYF